VRPTGHRIEISPLATQEVLLAWHHTQSTDASRAEAERLKKALVDHWLAEANAMRRDYRYFAAMAALREVRRLDRTPAHRQKVKEVAAIEAKLESDMYAALHRRDEGRYPEAIEILRGMLAVKPDDAKAHALLGTLYAATGRKELGIDHLRQVAKCDPDNPSGEAMLGWLAYLDDRPEEALAALRRADEIEPYTAKVHYHMGLALSKLKKWPEAASAVRQAVTIDPAHAAAYQALSHALREQGQKDEALRAARRAAKLSQNQNADILMSLAEAYADTGRFSDARDTAERAADLAKTTNPQILPQLMRRIEEYRQRAKAASK